MSLLWQTETGQGMSLADRSLDVGKRAFESESRACSSHADVTIQKAHAQSIMFTVDGG